LSAAAFAQSDYYYQVGYAANLTGGDSEINISNDGFRAGFFNNGTLGNICVNVFVFDPAEEEIACCSCLVTPNGLVSLSAQKDLIANTLTPAIPQSIVIKLTSTVPGTTTGTSYTVCNPATTENVTLTQVGDTGVNDLTNGLVAWGVTTEPSGSAGTYTSVSVPFLAAQLFVGGNAATPGAPAPAGSEDFDLTSICAFTLSQGTGYGMCSSCALGALSGVKK
jgi:hypothetical protein